MAEQAPQPASPIWPGPDVLVAVRPRARAPDRVSLRWTIAQPIEPDQRVEPLDERVDLVGIGDA